MRSARWCSTLGALVASAGLASPASAGPVEDAAFGLGYIGFDIIGDENPLSGGIDLLVTNTFLGNPLDFGLSELSLTGPISLGIQTGGRFIRELEVGLQTAVNTERSAQPMGFNFFVDSGPVATEFSGTFLVDTKLRVSEVGFYDLSFSSSVRQTITQDDRGTRTSVQSDGDLGPITVSGNIFLDTLAIVTNPLYEQAGRTNPFVQLSGPNSISDLLLDSGSESQGALASGTDAGKERAVLGKRVVARGTEVNGVVGAFSIENRPTGRDTAPGLRGRLGTAVPEPTVLLMLLAGLPAVFRRRRRA